MPDTPRSQAYLTGTAFVDNITGAITAQMARDLIVSGAIGTDKWSNAAPALVFSTTNTDGVASSYLRSDATVAIFDATSPSSQAFGDAAVVGVAAVAARRDHKHAMMAAPAGGTPGLTLGTANSAGVASTFLRDDDTILVFDATVPGAITAADTAATGAATVAARRDHRHSFSSSQAITITTAAQPNITSLGSLTGDLTFADAVSEIVPGATSFSHRNNADNADNLIITDAGNTTIRGSLTMGSTLALDSSGVVQVAAQPQHYGSRFFDWRPDVRGCRF